MSKSHSTFRWGPDGPHHDHTVIRNVNKPHHGSFVGRCLLTAMWRCYTCQGELVFVEQWEEHR